MTSIPSHCRFELVDQATEVTGAITIAVEEAADVDLVEDRRLEPQRVGLEPVGRLLAHAQRTTWLWPGSSRT